jgi:predicted nucleotidyltransferase
MLTQEKFRVLTSEVTQSIRGLLGVKLDKVILYGSYARGDYDENSDIDIMVLGDIDDVERSQYLSELIALTRDVELNNDVFISFFINNKDLFYERLPLLPFNQNVINDGIELYVNS